MGKILKNFLLALMFFLTITCLSRCGADGGTEVGNPGDQTSSEVGGTDQTPAETPEPTPEMIFNLEDEEGLEDLELEI